jgi:hypothetical protein
MHPSPDYSATYVVLKTDTPEGLEGHGLTFTSGRGNEICVAAVHALRPLMLGKALESITADMRAFWRSLTSDGQLRWIGPEKGVLHLATAAIVNAAWDLYAKAEGKPLWKLSFLLPGKGLSCRSNTTWVSRQNARDPRGPYTFPTVVPSTSSNGSPGCSQPSGAPQVAGNSNLRADGGCTNVNRCLRTTQPRRCSPLTHWRSRLSTNLLQTITGLAN